MEIQCDFGNISTGAVSWPFDKSKLHMRASVDTQTGPCANVHVYVHISEGSVSCSRTRCVSIISSVPTAYR